MKPPLTSWPIQMQAGTFEHRSLSRDRWRKSISAFQQHSPSSRYFGLSYCCWSYVMSIFGVIFLSGIFVRNYVAPVRRCWLRRCRIALRKMISGEDVKPDATAEELLPEWSQTLYLVHLCHKCKKQISIDAWFQKRVIKKDPWSTFYFLRKAKESRRRKKRMYELTWQVVQER